jgi:hypothetical protein|tara:strand:+ start:35788 stop:36705 length:918 start_codon:yes stop_codon:yes gene_type:complete
MLKTFELLDRFELLYPTNSKISDLRRAYIDKDISSIFRLLPTTVSGDKEDLCKAVIDKNLHSVFRLINDEDLRKLILEDNTWKLWPLLDNIVETQFTKAFKNFFVNETKIWNDCFSRGQIQSKLWLVDELKKCNVDLGTVFLCAGWYATLATMIFESDIKVDKIRSFDIDRTCVDIAETFNKPWFVDQWKFKSITQDIMDIDYREHTWQFWSKANDRMSYPITDIPDTIINTSCEHIENFDTWYNKIPTGKLVVLQSNDFMDVDEHVNCVKDSLHFEQMAPLSKVLFTGELDIEKYTRYMRIGIR